MDVNIGADAVRALIAEHRRADCINQGNDRVLIQQRDDGMVDIRRWTDGMPISRAEVYNSVDFTIRKLQEQGWLDGKHTWTPSNFYREKTPSHHRLNAASPPRANPAYQKKTPEQAFSDRMWALAMASNQEKREGSPSAAARNDRIANIIVSVIAVLILVGLVVACAAFASLPTPRDTSSSTSSVSATHSPPNRSLSSLTAAQWRQLSASDQFNLVEAARKNLTCPVSVSTTVRDVDTVYAAPNVIDKSPSEILPGIALLEGCK